MSFPSWCVSDKNRTFAHIITARYNKTFSRNSTTDIELGIGVSNDSDALLPSAEDLANEISMDEREFLIRALSKIAK